MKLSTTETWQTCANDVLKVRGLLKSFPEALLPWMQALGESDPGRAIKRLKMAFDALLPGLISIPSSRQDGGFGAKFNVFTAEKALSIASGIALHSPKLTFSHAQGSVPFDAADDFPEGRFLIGAHQANSPECYDFFLGAKDVPGFKQIVHIIKGGGIYELPCDLEKHHLHDDLHGHLSMLERLIASSNWRQGRKYPVISGLPQILLPDPSSPTGYLNLTPLASGGVLGKVSESMFDFLKNQVNEVESTQNKKRLLSSSFLPCVSKKQNLSGIIGAVRRVYFADSPAVDRAARSAFTLANDPQLWVKLQIRQLERSREQEDFRRCLKKIRAHVDDVISRIEFAGDGTGKNSVSHKEMIYEKNAIRWLSERLIKRWLLACDEYPSLLEEGGWSLDKFDDLRCAQLLMIGLVDAIGITVSSATENVWLRVIQAEVNSQLHSTVKVGHVGIGNN